MVLSKPKGPLDLRAFKVSSNHADFLNWLRSQES